MYIVAVIMEKGGVGKTTVALNLAVAAVQDGRNAAVIDIDQQATASNWTDRRTTEKPWVVPTLTARLSAAIEKAREQGIDFLVIDTPPHSGMDAAEAARRADVVLLFLDAGFAFVELTLLIPDLVASDIQFLLDLFTTAQPDLFGRQFRGFRDVFGFAFGLLDDFVARLVGSAANQSIGNVTQATPQQQRHDTDSKVVHAVRPF